MLIITIAVSYAYFTATITGEEAGETITVTGGKMHIHYDSNKNIIMNNIVPKADPAATKQFTITGDNTTLLFMNYQLELVIVENTFSEGALKWKMISTNNDNNGTVAPSIPELQDLSTGSQDIDLGEGKFAPQTEGGRLHTYDLDIHFPRTNEDQNEDQQATFAAYIRVSAIR